MFIDQVQCFIEILTNGKIDSKKKIVQNLEKT